VGGVVGIRRVWVGLGRAESEVRRVASARGFPFTLGLWGRDSVLRVVCLSSRLKLTAGSTTLVCGVLMLL
jgi:hypothetical protein